MKCVYCCNEIKEEEFAREHVPPKSFFKKGTSSLITIPACRACNNKKSSDDEFVLNILSMSDLISINPQHQSHIDKMLQAVKRPQKVGFIKEVMSSTHTAITPEGSTKAFTFDESKVSGWAGINAQGLLVHEEHIEHCNYKHSTIMLNLLKVEFPEEKQLLEQILSFTKSTPSKRVGYSEFEYWIQTQDEGYVVIQCFYQELFFLTMVERCKI